MEKENSKRELKTIKCYSEFKKIFADILNEHDPFKKKLLWASMLLT